MPQPPKKPQDFMPTRPLKPVPGKRLHRFDPEYEVDTETGKVTVTAVCRDCPQREVWERAGIPGFHAPKKKA